MKLAILFWFYKEPEICRNHLELLRQDNPNASVYGLYGGNVAEADRYKLALDEYLDDFYTFSEDKDTYWKWIQGDLMIAQWYRDRGQHLSWDTLIIVQWDMLVFGAIENIFSMLKPDQILLSGLRPIQEVEADWGWVTPKVPERRQQYIEFLEHVQKTYNYQGDPLGCLFIVVCLPRAFLEKYSQVEQAELGFIEYRIPIYAQIFGIPFCEDHLFNAWWVDNDPTFWTNNPLKQAWNNLHSRFAPNPLNPAKLEISLIPIYRHLRSKTGARIFHPYERCFPITKQHWIRAVLSEFSRDFSWLVRKLGFSQPS
jgi:hypothetical protein